MKSKKVELILFLGLILIIAVLVCKRDVVMNEIAKIALEFLFITITGSFFSFLIAEHTYYSGKTTAVNDKRKEFINRLTKIYTTTKKVRRLLRGRRNSLETYNKLLEEIISAELDCESMHTEIETITKIVRDDTTNNKNFIYKYFEKNLELFKESKRITVFLSEMEAYLKLLIDEFEANAFNLKNDNFDIDNTNLDEIKSFIAQSGEEDSSFKDLKVAYNSVLEAMRKDVFSF